MQRLSAIIVFTVLPLSFVGCSLCHSPTDFDYPTYGGIHQRADPARGRVGSVLSDPFADFSGPSADSNLDAYPEPRGVSSGSGSRGFDDDDDFERQDEDLDDDLEDLDRELESIDPLDDEPELDGAGSSTKTARRSRRGHR